MSFASGQSGEWRESYFRLKRQYDKNNVFFYYIETSDLGIMHTDYFVFAELLKLSSIPFKYLKFN